MFFFDGLDWVIVRVRHLIIFTDTRDCMEG